MLALIVLALFATALAQPADGSIANPWLITCGYKSATREREWNVYRCFPETLIVNNLDYVKFQVLNAANIIVFNGLLGPQGSLNRDNVEANPLCFLGRTPVFGGRNLSAPGGPFTDGLFHYAFPSFVDGAVYVTDPTRFYSSGIFLEADNYTRSRLFDLPVPVDQIPDNYMLRFNSTNPGPYNWSSCFETFVKGTITIGTPIKTIADIETERQALFAQLDTRFLQLSDIHKLGGQYRTPETQENDEGFLTHFVKVGHADPVTDAFYNAFGTPNFTITAGDTVAFVNQWYKSTDPNNTEAPFIHTLKFNVTRENEDWVPEYHATDTPAAYPVLPLPDAGGNLIFQPYFPRGLYITAFGMWDSGFTWLGYGDPANFEDGHLSLGGMVAVDRFSTQKNSKNVTFPKDGYFPYACTLHYFAGMHGAITVLPRTDTPVRNKYQVDASLNKVKLKHLVDYVAQDTNWPNPKHIEWKLVSGTHGVLQTTSDAGTFETPLLVQFLVTYTLLDPRPFSQTSDLKPLQDHIVNFLALRTFTGTDAWSVQNVQTTTPKSKRDTGDQVDVTFVITYSSAGALGWSLALFLTSLFLLLVQ